MFTYKSRILLIHSARICFVFHPTHSRKTKSIQQCSGHAHVAKWRQWCSTRSGQLLTLVSRSESNTGHVALSPYYASVSDVMLHIQLYFSYPHLNSCHFFSSIGLSQSSGNITSRAACHVTLIYCVTNRITNRRTEPDKTCTKMTIWRGRNCRPELKLSDIVELSSTPRWCSRSLILKVLLRHLSESLNLAGRLTNSYSADTVGGHGSMYCVCIDTTTNHSRCTTYIHIYTCECSPLHVNRQWVCIF